MKIIAKILLIFLGILLISYLVYCLYMISPLNKPVMYSPDLSPYYSGTDYDGTYTIEGQKVTLDHGKSEVRIPNSNAVTVTHYFGNGVKADLDKDGRIDDAFIVTQNTGGTGLFYYFVARLNKTSGPIGSEAVFLGDRIAPQTTYIDNGKTTNNTNRENVIVINFAERNPGEPMSTKPSLGKSIWLKLDLISMKFGEVTQNFEGESNL